MSVQTEVLVAGYWRGTTDFGRHQHASWELIYQLSGRVRTWQEDVPFEMSPGMVVLHPPGVFHRDEYFEPYELIYLYLNADGTHWPTVFHDDVQRTVGNLAEAIYRETLENDQASTRLTSLLGEALGHYLDRLADHKTRSSAERRIAQACRILEQNVESQTVLEQVAQEVGMSRSAFFSAFRTYRRVTPSEYLRSLRIRRALALLRHTDLTLETIAVRSGFSSASHLSRVIKDEYGKRPGELRTSPTN